MALVHLKEIVENLFLICIYKVLFRSFMATGQSIQANVLFLFQVSAFKFRTEPET